MVGILTNRKGLTLVELLAVVVILGIVAVIAVPAIGNTIKNSKVRADIGTLNMITDAAMRWSLDQQASGNDGETTAAAAISTLVDSGYLSSFQAASQSKGATVTFTSYTVAVSETGAITVTVYSDAAGTAANAITSSTFTS